MAKAVLPRCSEIDHASGTPTKPHNLFKPAGVLVSFEGAGMERHAAKLEGNGALAAQRLEEIFQAFEQRVHLRQLDEIVGNGFRHCIDGAFCDTFVGHDYVYHTDLDNVVDHAAEGVL